MQTAEIEVTEKMLKVGSKFLSEHVSDPEAVVRAIYTSMEHARRLADENTRLEIQKQFATYNV